MKRLKTLFFYYFLYSSYFVICSCALYGSDKFQEKYNQWFVGPILTPASITLDPKHPAIEIALGIQDIYGSYNSNWKRKNNLQYWSITPYIDFMAGLNKLIGIEFLGAYSVNLKKGKCFSHMDDIIFRLGFQILNDKKGTYIPDFRIIFQEKFPTGKYDKLTQKNHVIETTGNGAYETGLYLSFQKLFKLQSLHDLKLHFVIGYFIPSSCSLEGLNVYGGTKDTTGKMKLGNLLDIFFTGEYSLSRKWALACETNFQFRDTAKFKGTQGIINSKSSAKINTSSFVQFVILPEIQHTFTSDTGMLLGGWFTLAGKNSIAFGAGFLSLLHTF